MTNGRACTKCLRNLPADSFYTNANGKNGLNPSCKDCCRNDRDSRKIEKAIYDRGRRLADLNKDRKRRKVYRDANLEKSREKEREYAEKNKSKIQARKKAWSKNNRDRLRHQELMAAYGIGTPEFEFMRAAQGGRCAICQEEPDERSKGTLHVDHNHSSGKVRGLLCSPCNKAIGMLRDRADLADAAASYLRAHALGLAPASS